MSELIFIQVAYTPPDKKMCKVYKKTSLRTDVIWLKMFVTF